MVGFLSRGLRPQVPHCLQVQGGVQPPPVLPPGRAPGCGVARHRALLSQNELLLHQMRKPLPAGINPPTYPLSDRRRERHEVKNKLLYCSRPQEINAVARQWFAG